ncbi:MAG: hypothetical protein ACLQT7_00635 [Candidatus Dormibacteria bacterium]
MTERLTAAALRARVRAAIGEPELARPGFDLDPARVGRRRWRGRGLGAAPAPVRAAAVLALVVAVASALTVGTVLHLRSLPKPAGSSNGPAGQGGATAGATPSGAAAGFVPLDVTAVSAGEWWVLGDGGAGCSGSGCVRILHTVDGGQTFTAVATPSSTLTGLRFLNSQDGWAFGGSTVWSTHDAGAEWIGFTIPGTVEELETSGGFVYALAGEGSSWTLERSPTGGDSWQQLSLPAGGRPGNLNVHGSDVWVTLSGGTGDNQVLTSTDDGAHFSAWSICPGATGVASLDAVSPDDLWAACSVGASEDLWRSSDGGQSFSPLQGGAYLGPSWGTIAGPSATTAVLAGTSLEVTVDGGQSFQGVKSLKGNGSDWSIVGFTTAEDGFALSYPTSALGTPDGLWRTEDGGGSWYEVEFP